MDNLIPKHVSPGEFMDAIHDATGIAPAGYKNWQFGDTDTRVRKAKMLREAIIAYVDRPRRRYEKIKEQVQAYWKSSDLPDPITDSFARFEDVRNFDMAWMEAFSDSSNMIEQGRDFWEVLTDDTDTTRGDGKFGWTIVPEGDKVDLIKATGSLTSIKVKKFGSGIEWGDELIRFRRISVMVDLAAKFQRGYNTDKADRFYTLLGNAAGATNETDIGTSTLEKDISAINTGAYDMLNAVKNTRNLPESTELLLYVSPQHKARILRALGEVSQAFSGSTTRVVFNVRPIFTFNSNLGAASSGFGFAGLMVIPGHKNQWAQLMDVTMFEDRDITSLSFIQTAFAYYGGAVLDTNQVRRINFKA